MKARLQKISPYIISFSIIALMCGGVLFLVIRQTTPPPWCGKLANDSCRLLREAQLATANLHYGAIKASLMYDIQDTFSPNIKLSLFAEGEYFRVPITRQVSFEARPLMGLDARLTVTLETEGILANLVDTSIFPLELRYMDGVGYAKLTTSVDGVPTEQWYSANLGVYMMQLVQSRMLPANWAESLNMNDFDVWADLAPHAETTYHNTRRVEAIRYDVFTLEISGRTLYDVFLKPLLNQMGTENIAFQQFLTIYEDFFSSAQLTIIQYVGQESRLVQMTDVIFTRKPTDMQASNNLFGGFSQLDMTIQFHLEYTQFSPMIPPEDAQSVPYQDLFGRPFAIPAF